jgi:hypothetical protein
MKLTRRGLLSTTAIIPVFLAVRCSNTPTSTVASDANTLVAGSEALLAALTAAGINLTANQQSSIQTALTTIETNAQAIAAATTPSSETTVAQEAVSAATVIGDVVAPFFPEAPAAVDVVDAVVSLAQAVYQDVVNASTVTTPTAGAALPALAVGKKAYRQRTRFTVSHAKGILHLKG